MCAKFMRLVVCFNNCISLKLAHLLDKCQNSYYFWFPVLKTKVDKKSKPT